MKELQIDQIPEIESDCGRNIWWEERLLLICRTIELLEQIDGRLSEEREFNLIAFSEFSEFIKGECLKCEGRDLYLGNMVERLKMAWSFASNACETIVIVGEADKALLGELIEIVRRENKSLVDTLKTVI